ncbi:dipeptidase [Corynebacterium uberis]|uniref:dipeptidase n=1 Tax=Corynebacterium TaxID=1716 RepID=UPI001D0AB599|nr:MULTISPECIES: dipeptidase [Corynebacterium]MCZ9309732.1 dipeptidase [Corynebacterium sp. c6VSa_13]UDL73536.1 dipeptidase [Corynebacterium uberis]UDL77797.1 dipeptidase [Corynebacterium uberis]UDL82213.1 dipeptidase [Corynebacterium uberis]UDL84421.1 dipeptidase [Corynebacterium uberis]
MSYATVEDHVRAERDTIFQQLKQIVSYNSVHGEPELASDAAGACSWVAEHFEELGFSVERIATADGSTAVVGKREPAPGRPTVLLYSHYDVVPAGNPATWTTDPFTLTERDGRWYGRGAADCKGNLVMHLAALRAVEAAGGSDIGITVVVEGSEERGGEGLDALIESRPELFKADAIMIADTGNAAVGTPTLTTSLRGGAQLTVTVSTLETAIHSGNFGGAAPDAAFALVRTLDSLRDQQGRTVIEGVDTSARWDGEPYTPEAFRADAGVLDGVNLMGTEADSPADFVWARPAVTITGWTSTPVAEAVNAVPPRAQAKINLRVPAGMDAQDTADKLANHLRNHAPWGAHIDVEIDDVNQGFATDVTKPALTLLRSCLAQAYGTEESATIGSGGSIPLTTALQNAFPDAEIALYGVEEPTTTIHSADESVDPTEIERIAIAEALFLLQYGK